MLVRARNHGASVGAARRPLVLAVMALATLGQFFALSHEATVRHFRCAEHGELTHLASLPVALVAEAATAPRAGDGLRGGNLGGVVEHEHCAAVFTVQGGACAAADRAAVRLVVRPPAAIVSLGAAATGRDVVLSSAPKTSPPLA